MDGGWGGGGAVAPGGHAGCQTDGQTDRQNYDPKDRASIAAPRGKNET